MSIGPAVDTFVFWWMGLFGAAAGSFLNAVIFRLPRGYRLGLPSRSACTKCKRQLPWFENVPVLSYLVLRGQCAGCSAKISARYPMVELVTAALFMAVYRHYGLQLATLYYCWFTAALVAITFIDLDFRIIPDVISLPGIVLGVVASLVVPEFGPVSSLLGALTGGGAFFLTAWGYAKIAKREGLGMGDVKLLAMIGAFLGPKGALGTILISSIVGSVVGLALILIQRKNLKTAIPYGPFLALGALGYLFWGDTLAMRIYSQY